MEDAIERLSDIAENPRFYANLGTAAVGATAGFVANSVPKEILDKTGRTEKWSKTKRILGGASASTAQIAGFDYLESGEISTSFKSGYAAGGGATYGLPHKEKLNEYMEYWDALVRRDRI